jgi:hypothetical protein
MNPDEQEQPYTTPEDLTSPGLEDDYVPSPKDKAIVETVIARELTRVSTKA